MSNQIKITTIFASFLLFTHSIWGQEVFLFGKIKNPKSDSIELFLNPVFEKSSKIKARIKNGTFLFYFKINRLTPALLNTTEANIEMLIFPNDSLTVSFDENQVIQSIFYKGKRENEYNYFVKYRQQFNLPYGMFTKPDWSDVFGMSPIDFKTYRIKKIKTDLEFFDSFCKQHKVSEEFKLYAKAEIEYSYYYALLSYSSLRQYFKKINDTLPSDFYKEINKGLFQNHKNFISHSYLDALKAYVYQYLIGNVKSTVQFYPLALNIGNKNFTDTTLYCFETLLIKDMFQSDLQTRLKDSIYNSFINSCKNPVLLDYVKALNYSNKNTDNVFSEKALNTSLISTTGEKLLLKDFLKINKGKVIYIDVWASFCAPCRIEMPYSEKLQQKYMNKRVTFAYFSVDTKKEAWNKAIENLYIKNNSYIIENGLKSNLCQYLNIFGVPHYILLDNQGRIVLPSASRPSSLSTETSIDELLK